MVQEFRDGQPQLNGVRTGRRVRVTGGVRDGVSTGVQAKRTEPVTSQHFALPDTSFRLRIVTPDDSRMLAAVDSALPAYPCVNAQKTFYCNGKLTHWLQ